MYNSNTKSLIIVGAHLMKKNKGHYVQFVSLIGLIYSLQKFGIYLFFFFPIFPCLYIGQPEQVRPAHNLIGPNCFQSV